MKIEAGIVTPFTATVTVNCFAFFLLFFSAHLLECLTNCLIRGGLKSRFFVTIYILNLYTGLLQLQSQRLCSRCWYKMIICWLIEHAYVTHVTQTTFVCMYVCLYVCKVTNKQHYFNLFKIEKLKTEKNQKIITLLIKWFYLLTLNFA